MNKVILPVLLAICFVFSSCSGCVIAETTETSEEIEHKGQDYKEMNS